MLTSPVAIFVFFLHISFVSLIFNLQKSQNNVYQICESECPFPSTNAKQIKIVTFVEFYSIRISIRVYLTRVS